MDFIIVLLTLLFSAFFSGMEIAFVSANKLRLELDKKKEGSTAKIINIFSKNPSQYISTMLIGNNIALVIYGIVMAKILEPYIGLVINNQWFILTIQTLLSTLIILFTAEFLPKTIYRVNPNTYLKAFALPTYFFYILFYPLAKFTIFLSNRFIKNVLRVKVIETEKTTFGKLDLGNLVSETQNTEELNDEIDLDVKIFQNALDFSTVKLRECIVPRTEIVAVSIDEKVETLRNKFIETGHSKILVYQDSIDNIIGYAHSIKLFENPQSVRAMIRKIPIVPETMSANKLLSLFTKQHKSMALVVDEFGGTSGIATMEDILEEIIGDIQDEHDKVKLVDKKMSEDEYLFSGRQEIDDMNEKYDLNLPESEDYETIAGLILDQYGSIPQIGDEVLLDSFLFKVVRATTTKIELVQLTIINKTSEEEV